MSQTTPHNILHWIDENFEKPVIVICLLVALILIPYQVFTRYILGTWLQFNVDTSWWKNSPSSASLPPSISEPH